MPHLLGMTDVTSIACLDCIEPELLLYIARLLICEKPAAIGRLLCCCRTLAQLGSADSVGEELRKARRLVARERLFELRALADQQPAALAPLVTQITRPLSFTALRPEIDEPSHLDISRWRRPARPDPRHAAPHEAEWATRGTAPPKSRGARGSRRPYRWPSPRRPRTHGGGQPPPPPQQQQQQRARTSRAS